MKNLPTPYQDFIHKSRYARWNETDKRREDWDETVDRYLDYVTEHVKKEHDFDIEGHNIGLYPALRIKNRDFIPPEDNVIKVDFGVKQ